MKKLLVPVAALAIISVTGCLKSDTESTPRSAIMVNLLSPNAANTNIYLNGTAIGTNVSYGSVAAGYNQVNAGSTTVQITNTNNSATLLNGAATLTAGRYYSAFVIDSVSRLKMITVVDSVTYPATTDSVKVRFYNLSPGSTPVSVGIKDSVNALWTTRSFETQATADMNNIFKLLKTGSYTFRIKDVSGLTLKDTTMALAGGKIYTLYTRGFYTDTAKATAYGLGLISH